MIIDIVDLDIGNVSSISNMLGRLGIMNRVITSSNELESSELIILPGVGSYDTGMNAIEQNGLINTLKHKVVKEKTPILGICLGAQLLLDGSEEGIEKGLGFVSGNCVKFKFADNNLKIPHMGWKEQLVQKENEFFSNQEFMKFYFVHSYHFSILNKEDELLETEYGYHFCTAFHRDNVIGVQFHPEKSHKYGMTFFSNFYKAYSK